MKLFDRFKKPAKKAAVTDPAPRNEYYETISARLGVLQVVLFLSLFAFVVLAFLFNTELITYRNFYYFFQDLSASAETVDIFDADSLSYPTSEEQDFAVYRGGLAVAGNNSVTVFSATGRQLLSESVQMRNPTAVGKGKYLLVYEMGGTQYVLCNSNAVIHEGKTEFPIIGAAVSDSGMYALTTSEKRTASVVSLYNDRFQAINAYRMGGYVTDVAIDADGKRIAILTSKPEDGFFSTTCLLAVPGKGEKSSETTVSSAIGISCAFFENGNVAVITADGAALLSADGKLRREISFDGRELALSELSETGGVVVLKKNRISEKNIVIVFDKDGKIVYNKTVSEDILQVSHVGNAVFWMTDTGVRCRNWKDGTSHFISCQTEERVLLAMSETEALCCSPKKAIYLSFEMKS